MAITAAAGGGNWNADATWVGSVQPTAADDVLFTASSGQVTIPSSTTALCRSLDCTGYTNTLTFAATSSKLNVGDGSGGAVKFVGTMTLTLTGIGTITFLASTASTTYALRTAGLVMPKLTINAAATTTIQFADSVTSTGQALTLTTGILNDNGNPVSANNFIQTGGTLTASGAWSITDNGGSLGTTPWSVTGGTVTHTGSITFTVTSTKTRTFAGFGQTYGTFTYTVAGSTGQLTITGANTFTTISFSDASNARTMVLPASTTTTATNFTVNGTSGKLMTVKSSSGGTAATLALAQTSTMTYLSVQDITATPNLAVYALYSTNVSGNTGIVFTPPLAPRVNINQSVQRAATR